MANYQPLQEKAYAYLKEQILSGQLKPGEIYSETRTAAQIGVSRTPMKDALVRLRQDRFIDILPSKGFRLHEMSQADIWSTFQVRTAIEGFCALQLAREKQSDGAQTTLALLSSTLEAMADCIRNDQPLELLLDHDLRFHEALVHFSDNPELIDLFQSFNHRLSSIAAESFRQPGRPQEALEEHRRIYQAILASDGENDLAAYQAVMVHMSSSRDIVLQQDRSLPS